MVGEPLCLRPWQQKRVCLSPGCRLCLGKARQQLPYALRSCQRQAHSLRRWLELSRAEPRAEDQEAEQQVEEELQKVRRGRLVSHRQWEDTDAFTKGVTRLNPRQGEASSALSVSC